MSKKIGYVIAGSLTEGLIMRLNPEYALEEVKAGKFVCVKSSEMTFFSLVTDIELEVTHPDILLFPPTEREPLLNDIVKRNDAYAKVTLKPMLMLDKYGQRMPVKTIPSHFTAVHEATREDVALIFGSEEQSKAHFTIGNPLDMDADVCLDLALFSERSNGIFGKSGTGKTFLTRLILAGIVKSELAVNLIFDMHSEYGLQARKEGKDGSFVKGLKTLFPNKVAIFSLDPESTRRRGASPDVEVMLSYDDIRVEDVLALQDELNLHPTAIEAAYLITSKYHNKWLSVLLAQEKTLKEFADSIGAHAESVGALYRKLKRLERFKFLSPLPTQVPVIERMLDCLGRGIHVVLEFGNNTSLLCYLLISGIITRRIHEVYVDKTEKYLASQRKEDEPIKLIITIEEAHKFLNPQAAKQTIFGIIAREMRKYYVSLLVVDQRPSGIDEEVLSQIGTKLVALLNDEKDIAAVLTGVNNASGLRSILASLDSKKQALVMGHAVPMPVVIRTRSYDEKFYEAVSTVLPLKGTRAAIDEIF